MVGREQELEQLKAAYSSDKSEFVAVYGRRRVGKTFLISECFGNRFAFSHAGMEGASLREQLENFRLSLWRQGDRACPRFKSWLAAFSELERFLEACPDRRKVVFIDELPWLDTPRSGFLRAFESFWNGWACLRKDIVLVICGSATSWIVKKVRQQSRLRTAQFQFLDEERPAGGNNGRQRYGQIDSVEYSERKHHSAGRDNHNKRS